MERQAKWFAAHRDDRTYRRPDRPTVVCPGPYEGHWYRAAQAVEAEDDVGTIIAIVLWGSR